MDLSSPYQSMPWTPAVIAGNIRRAVEEHRRQQGQRLLALRQSKGWSQEDAAHRVAVAVKTWSNWERGITNPYESNWRKIEEAFSVDAALVKGMIPSPLALDAPSGLDLSGVLERLDRIEARLDDVERVEAKLDEILALLKGVSGDGPDPRVVDLGSAPGSSSGRVAAGTGRRSRGRAVSGD